MPKTETALLSEMCWDIHHWEKDWKTPPESRVCQVLMSVMYSAKTNLQLGSPRRVFVEDLSASLNRKQLLPNEKVQHFQETGFAYMKLEQATQ